MSNGKTAAYLWNGRMVFKLDKKAQEKALQLEGAKIGSHLYAPDRPMKGWVSLPEEQADRWLEFAISALSYVGKLK